MQSTLSSPPFLFACDYLSGKGISHRDISWEPLAGDGSDRMLYRLVYPGNSVILAVNENPPANDRGINENDSFFYIANHLRSKGFAAPEILAFSRERGWFILEDLGDEHLQDRALMLKDNPAELEALYRQVLTMLPQMQVNAARDFDTGRIHSEPYDKTFVRRWESDYFITFFVSRYCHCAVKEGHLAHELDALAEQLAEVPVAFFLYRDFQSRNIMIRHGELRLLDFQGARLGPLHYDLASLLLDPYVDLAESLREKLMDYYLDQVRKLVPVTSTIFMKEYPVIALHRNMQMLGAFAYLCQVKGKTYFASYMPAALNSLNHLLKNALFSPYCELRKVVEQL